MTTLPPAIPGMPLAEVDTPALLIDLDAFERNLKRMADAVSKAGVRLRPHAKTHKSPIIGLKQIAHGAIGLCCQKVSEATVMVEGGVQDVLVSNEVIGARKLDRLAALSRQARVIGCVDNPLGVSEMAAAAGRHGARLDVIVEIDVGASRCGVAPGKPAVELAQAIAREKHLRFAGLQAYQGRAQHFRTIEERRAAIDEAVTRTKTTVQALKAAGLSCDIVGGAGTGTFELEAASGVYNELQAGSYIFMDADYARNKRADGGPYDTFEHALFVYATVMSMTQADRAVIDAGLKSFTFESGPPEPVGFAGAIYERPSDEHGNLNLAQSNTRPSLGDKVRLIPGHCDPTVNLHDWYVGIRGMDGQAAVVESVWPVAARGALF
ncbi:MAG TPA: DSD1 family PLP-dependent enzyme [Hyphomicrobiaceae bacterium]|nr:DSD1 family PLP-dependent enzyme [Hyphomicrobiaceae bacterium]